MGRPKSFAGKERQKQMTLLRYRAVADRFNHLHNVERIRFDDCIDTLCKEFFFAANTIHRALKMAPNMAETAEMEDKIFGTNQLSLPFPEVVVD